MRYLGIILLLGLSMMGMAEAKRAAAPQIAPIIQDGHRYAPAFERNRGGYAVFLVAQDEATGSQLWKTTLYERRFDPMLETDVQEVRPRSLRLNWRKTTFILEDEEGHSYRVRCRDGKLLD